MRRVKLFLRFGNFGPVWAQLTPWGNKGYSNQIIALQKCCQTQDNHVLCAI